MKRPSKIARFAEKRLTLVQSLWALSKGDKYETVFIKNVYVINNLSKFRSKYEMFGLVKYLRKVTELKTDILITKFTNSKYVIFIWLLYRKIHPKIIFM